MSGSTSSTPRRGNGRPEEPWLPATLKVWGTYPRERQVWVRNARTGERERRTRKRYDVRFRVDGYEFRFGLDQKGWADDFAVALQRDFAQGLLFDPGARRFVPLQQPASPGATATPDTSEGPTFFEHARDYVDRQWPHWGPATRRNAQRDLALACLHFVRDEAEPLERHDRLRADAYLREAVLVVPRPQASTDDWQQWEAWFDKWSLPLRAVTDRHVSAFLDWVSSEALDGTKRRLAPSSLARTRAVVRGTFTNARKRRVVDWDPWDAVEAPPLVDHDKVDPDLVMEPAEVWRVARACAEVDPRYHAYVLVQGLCGLRPGEARELRRADFDLTPGREYLRFGGTHSEVPDRFFADGEDRRRPLKGRGRKTRRNIPLPASVLPLLRWHLDRYAGPARSALAFTNTRGNRINSSNFHRDVWTPVRARVFEGDNPLRGVRPHDLRHAAITAWLNAGVPLKTAQRWSGHKTLSVLLDTYLGVMRADEDLARQRWEAAIDTDPVTGS